MRENKSGKINQANTGSKSNNFETNTKTTDLVLAEAALLSKKQEVEVTDKDIQDAIVYENGVTSIDFMMPEDEREILEKNLNVYSDAEKMQKALNIAKKNKLLSEDLKSLELTSELGKLSNKILELMMREDNLKALEEYLENKKKKNDVAKAYKEIGLMNKAMLDAREGMIQKMRVNRSKKSTRIALNFTNDNGDSFQLGIDNGGDE